MCRKVFSLDIVTKSNNLYSLTSLILLRYQKMSIFVYGFECVTKIKYFMEYLLKISSIGNEEERQKQVNGRLPST